ncbi:hypothetical protein P3W45_001234 [Vairimorpha bombi]
MFTILLSITNIICITDIKSGTSSHQSTEEKNDPVYINNRDLFITLANGSTYNLKDAVVTSSNNSNGKQHLVLQDGSEIDVNNTNLEILFNSNDNVKIHNVKNVESRDSNHVFDLENGEQIVVKDAKNVKEEDNGVYNVRTNDNTVMQNSNNEQNSKDVLRMEHLL